MSQIPEDLQHDYEIAKQLIRQGATHGAFEKMLIERIAQLQAERDALQQENGRLKAPVSRHNDVDGILQRFFITGGRQYRYVKEDAVALEKLLNEWIAARAAQTSPKVNREVSE